MIRNYGDSILGMTAGLTAIWAWIMGHAGDMSLLFAVFGGFFTTCIAAMSAVRVYVKMRRTWRHRNDDVEPAPKINPDSWM